MEAMQPRICIQPQSRRSPRCYITMIIRAPSRVFQFQDSQHSFQDCMDYILPGLHWKRFTTPCRIAYTAPSTAVAFPYLTAYLQVFCLFIFFGQFAPGWLAGPWLTTNYFTKCEETSWSVRWWCMVWPNDSSVRVWGGWGYNNIER